MAKTSFGSLVIFVLAQSTLSAVVTLNNKTDPGPTCKDLVTETEEDGQINVDYLLGTWYDTCNENPICLHFELLTDLDCEKLTNKLSLEPNAFENYSIIMTQKCPDKAYNASLPIHVLKKLEAKGEYKAVIVKNNTVQWGFYRAFAGKFSYYGKEYLGIFERPGQRFATILSKERQYYEDEVLHNSYVCFCKLSNICLG